MQQVVGKSLRIPVGGLMTTTVGPRMLWFDARRSITGSTSSAITAGIDAVRRTDEGDDCGEASAEWGSWIFGKAMRR